MGYLVPPFPVLPLGSQTQGETVQEAKWSGPCAAGNVPATWSCPE